MYKTVKRFVDLQDGGYVYNVGDTFPHRNLSVDNARILELSTTSNRRGTPLIKRVSEATDDPENALGGDTPTTTRGTGTKAKKRARKTKE